MKSMFNNCSNPFAVSDGCYTLWGLVLTAAAIGVIIVVIIVGNALVILAVMRDRRLKRQSQNWLIVSLAISDLLVGLLVTPLTLTYELLGTWQFGDILCELWLALDVLFVTASILNLCAISLDRYWCVTNPMEYPAKRTPRRIVTIILIVWVLAFAISFPPLVGWRPLRSPGECSVSNEMSYVLYSSSGSFFIPVAIILGVYAKIYSVTRKRAERKREEDKRKKILLGGLKGYCSVADEINKPRGAKYRILGSIRRFFSSQRHKKPSRTSLDHEMRLSPEMTTRDYQPDPVSAGTEDGAAQNRNLSQTDVQVQLLQRRKLQKRRERQATLILGLILAAFVLCWLPFFAVYVLGAICCQPPELVFDIFFWLGYCNSGLNPVIYNYLNQDYRRAFRKILTFKKFT